jgi:hypothetical protein
VQCWIYGSVREIKDLIGASLELLDDRIPMHGTVRNDSQQQQVEMSFQRFATHT